MHSVLDPVCSLFPILRKHCLIQKQTAVEKYFECIFDIHKITILVYFLAEFVTMEVQGRSLLRRLLHCKNIKVDLTDIV